MTINDAITDYLGAHGNYAASTLRNFTDRLNRLARFFSKRGIEQIVNVRAQDLDGFLESLVQIGAEYSTRCAYMFTARAFFRWLHKRGKLLSNPARDMNVYRDGSTPLPEPPLTEDEISTVLDKLPRRSVIDLRNRLHLELLYSCGLRLTESLTLKVADFDLENRSVRIKGKGGKVRVLPLMKGTLAALKDYLALRRSLLRGPDDGTLLLGQTTGKPLSDVMIYPLLRKVRKSLRMKRRIHPHLFRHSIAVHLLQHGADIRHVQEFLGHASIDTTKIYLRMVPGRLKDDYDNAMPEIAFRTQVR